MRHPGAAVILPLVDADHVCLIRNHRVAVGETLIELPAGTLEPGEPPAATASRELCEETGYTAGKIQLLTSYYPSPGVMDERMYLFLATDLTPGPANLEAGEEIENLVVPMAQARQMVGSGEIQDGKTLAGLMWYWQFFRPTS